ncbi:MAG: NADH-quinone oxidoreductase subunit NuoE [Pseudomonadota bacterium]|nr:NADH-quinone oxidoreductase subunit NuoE [Pseudomonadota bacterium]
MILAEDKKRIDHWVAKFPEPKGAVLMALRVMQDRHGWLSEESIDAVSAYLGLAKVDVYEVVSFYSMYRRTPGGRHYIKICNSLSCCLAGSEAVIDYLQETLDVTLGGTTKDGQITLQETECLGACQGAPVALVNDTDYHLHITPESLNQLVDSLDTPLEPGNE